MQSNYLDSSGVCSTPGHSRGGSHSKVGISEEQTYTVFRLKHENEDFFRFLSPNISCLKPFWLTYRSKFYGFMHA